MLGAASFEPDEELLTDFSELAQEIETFLDTEFANQPELILVPEFLAKPPKNLGFPEIEFEGKYVPKGHQVIYNPHRFDYSRVEINEREMRKSDVNADIIRKGLETLENKSEKDILLEELFHAKHAEELGYDEPSVSSVGELDPKDFSGNPLEDEVDLYIVEGFADFGRSLLSGNWSLQATENVLNYLLEVAENSDASNGLGSKDREVDDTVQRYVGHLFFLSFNNEHHLEDTLELAFGNYPDNGTALNSPPTYQDLPEIFQQIESSRISYDSNVWDFAREHMEENYL